MSATFSDTKLMLQLYSIGMMVCFTAGSRAFLVLDVTETALSETTQSSRSVRFRGFGVYLHLALQDAEARLIAGLSGGFEASLLTKRSILQIRVRSKSRWER